MNQLLIPTNKGDKEVLVRNIIRVEARSSYSKIYFSNEHPLLVAKVLQWFETNLPDELFCRIHRTHLVNRMYVSEVFNRSSLTLTNGDIMQISRRKKMIYQFSKPSTIAGKNAFGKGQQPNSEAI
ncbi:MAG: LytTR family DNA-binding domain-containing protein [Ferruginibacter sp.]